MSDLDSTDRSLIGLLRQNSRTPIASLAAMLKLSRITVRSRIERLVASGVIESFTIKLGSKTQKSFINAVMLINVEGAKADTLIRLLNKIPDVVGVYSTSGQWDAIAMLEADSLARFDAILREISGSQGVIRTETSIMLTSRKKAAV
ncbi:MAG: Lrp/AsnC family transcriptional regulator [Cypionkella sp.]|nr:Lrp/AsnC family transcriptional regulator [Cypionkella sp.]